MHSEDTGPTGYPVIMRADELAGQLEAALRVALMDVRARILRLEALVAAAEALGTDTGVTAEARECLESLRDLATRHAWLDASLEGECAVPDGTRGAEVQAASADAARGPERALTGLTAQPQTVLVEAVEARDVESPEASGKEKTATETAIAHRRSITKKRLAERLRTWLEEARSVRPVSKPNTQTILTWKRLVCEGRLLLAAFGDASMETDTVKDEMRALSRAFDRLGDDGSFFAFNPARALTPGGWDELSRAMAAACASLRASALVRDRGGVLKEKERRELAARSLAAAEWARRILHDRVSVTDIHVSEAARSATETVQLIAEDGGEPVAPARGSRSQLAKALIEEIGSWEETAAKRAQSREAEQLIEQAPDDEVLPAIRAARSMGLPASNPTLLDRAATVRQQLSPDDDAEIIKFLDQREARVSGLPKADGAPKVAMKALDLEQVRKSDVVRNFCRGKVAVILGGKTKGQHAERYREEIGFREVIWRDTEKGTRVSALEPLVDQGDILIFNPKFSRHAYKSLVNRATQNGKIVVTLDHGYGVEQLIHTMFEQLSRRGYLV